MRVRTADESELQATVFTDFETFHSNFLAVPASTPPRNIGRMTLTQTVPTHRAGGMVQWSRAFGTKQYFTAGQTFAGSTATARKTGSTQNRNAGRTHCATPAARSATPECSFRI